MKYKVLLCVTALSVSAHADWLVLMGTPGRPDSDSIQVDPLAVDSVSGQRTLLVRVNRARDVTDADGMPYRSMEAEATVDCSQGSASFTRKVYYAQPDLGGPVTHQRFFGMRNPPPLQFDGIKGNYATRLIHAACKK